MYSLYRAWLSLGPCASLPPLAAPAVPLNLSMPAPFHVPDAPDVNLQVGPSMTHFSAHKTVLSAHSGFFKAALTNHTGLSPITVPNVNVDEFSSLLTFMYTGYLDLHIGNIYNILLATHILHMPRALELCRTFLLQQSHHQVEPTVQRVNVIKPIASRTMGPTMQEIFTPAALGGLKKSDEAPFRAVETSTSNKPSTSSSKSEKRSEPERKKVVPKAVTSKKRSVETAVHNASKDKIIVDVACCDGPVRFHRVINKNYGLQEDENHDNIAPQQSEQSRNKAMHKAMNENIMEKLKEDNPNGEVFTCLYCKHTFKSQYCYQKHARRHLYPVEGGEARREVRQLDMNVQYYPCKTCGSKFPSYYFVHKHRKMCHAQEMAADEAERRGAEGDGSSSCSAIDVEAVPGENQTEQIT